MLGARPNAAFATVSEMLEAARSPEGITAGSTQGLASHFLFLLMADRTGGTFKPVFGPDKGKEKKIKLKGHLNVWGATLNPLKTRSWAAEPSYPALGPSEISIRRAVQRFNDPNDQQGSFGDRPPRV